MKIRILLILLFGLLFQYGCTKSSPTEDQEPLDPNKEEEKLKVFKEDESMGAVKVMTRNVYVGTDVDVILNADPNNIAEIPGYVKQAFDVMESTNFTVRANALADEIAKTLPHVIGLQEMSNTFTQPNSDFLFGNNIIASDPLYNFEEILMAALDSRGLDYTVAASIENANIELPMLTGLTNPPLRDVRLVDHDMILVRNDVSYSNPLAVRYDSMLVVEPKYGIFVPRGYVKVNIDVGQTSFVFANTHLEAFNVDNLRMDQATQLISDLSAENLPVILVGDFNSRADGSGTVYNYVTGQGYTDAWLENTLTYNENGYTFGHQADLRNETPNFFERIDFIFTKSMSTLQYGEGFVLGDEARDKTPEGLWPSDHGGVVFKLIFPVPTKLAVN